MSAPIRVVIVDDHAVFRRGISDLLQEVTGMEVVGEASDASEAIRVVDAANPDVVLMDLTMPGGGVEATRSIIGRSPGVSVLVLTMHRDDEQVRRALAAGARGYLLKDSEAADIVRAIEAVSAGQAIFSPGVSTVVLTAGAEAPPYPFPSLTAREREVLERLACGLGAEVIARRLGLSTKTVQNNISRVLVKLGARDRAHAVAIARDAGFR